MPVIQLPLLWGGQPQEAAETNRGPLVFGDNLTGVDGGVWTAVAGPTRVEGAAGRAMRYTLASAQYLKRPVETLHAQRQTFWAVVRMRSGWTASQALVSTGAGTNDRTLLYVSGGAVLMFSGAGGTFGQATSGTYTDTANYHVIVGRVNGSDFRDVWVDGVQAATNATVVSPAQPNMAAVAAYWTSGAPTAGFYLTGDVAAAGILPFAMSPEDVGRLSANLSAYADMFLEPRRIWVPFQQRIQFDAAANSGYQAASSSYSFNRTVSGTNRFLAVNVPIFSAGQTVTSISDDSAGTPVPMVFIGARSTVTSFGRIECWGLPAAAVGTKQTTVNLSGVAASAAVATSYTGVHQATPTEAFNSAQDTNVGAADATVTVTPIASNTWIHGAVATNDGSITANQTSRNNVSGAAGSGANEDTGPIGTPVGTVISYTDVGAAMTWAIGGYALRPVGSVGASAFKAAWARNANSVIQRAL